MGVWELMTSYSPRLLARASEGLVPSLRTYLDCIAGKVPDSTFYSHKSVLSEFCIWIDRHQIELATAPENIAVQFLGSYLLNSNYSQSTVRGHVSTISNFLAYQYRRDPQLLKIKIASALREHPDSSLQDVGDSIIGDTETEPNSRLSSQIHDFITTLRQHQFGTRTHVYVEILLDTKSRPEQVRQLDFSDLNIDNGQILVGISETYVVRSVGLLTKRVCPLSATTLEALNIYLEYEREGSISDQRSPLLTTYDGRPSSSTLRRSVKQASASLASENQPQAIVPAKLWQYAIYKILS
ncbi:site-specific integrase [Haloarcula sp. Atlit-7R]|nr:site-specific integrase [Haloarcula sp. Atlit-7R]